MFNVYKLQEETDTKRLYANINDIMAYVASKIETFDPSKFEQQAKGWIIHYCEKYLHFKVPKQILNEFYDATYEYVRELVIDNEHHR